MKDSHVQHILFRGDYKEAIRWVPWAKSRLRHLKLHHSGFDGKSFGVMKYRPRGGDISILVIVKMINDQEWIIIEASGAPSLYMESGALDFVSTAPLNENTYLPGQLYYGSDINAFRGVGAELGKLRVAEIEPNKLNGDNMGPGDSRALGCPESALEEEVLATFSGVTGTITRKFTADEPTYCPDLILYKTYQENHPPSLYSGKLRQLVQGIYGSKRRDYSIDLDFPGSTPLRVKGGEFNPWGTGSSGLFSGRNYEYFRIRVLVGEIFATKLTPSKAGRNLRTYLLNNPDIPEPRRRRYEAYLLSTLYFEEDAENEKIGNASKIGAHGSPFAYGIAWNWKGDTGYVATHKSKDGTTNVWEATLHRIAVVERDGSDKLSEGRLQATAVVEEGPSEFTFRVNRDLLWTPDYEEGGMELFVTQDSAGDTPTHVDHDVPIFAIADYAGDGFDLVRHYNEELDADAYGKTASSAVAVSAKVDCSSIGCDVWSSASDAAKHGFYVESLSGGSDGFDARAIRGNDVQISAEQVTDEGLNGKESGLQNTNQSGNGISDWETKLDQAGCDTLDYSEIELPFGGKAYESDFSGSTFTMGSGSVFRLNSMLVVPYHDCDAVYLALTESVNAKNLVTQKTTSPASIGRELELWEGNILDFPDGWEPVTDRGRMRVGYSKLAGPTHPWEEAATFSPTFSDDLNWSRTKIVYRANGAEVTAFEKAHADNASALDTISIPSCVDMPSLTPDGGWSETGTGESTNFEFNPVVFPEPEKALSVLAQNSANFYSYRATKNPGGNGSTMDDGSYDFSGIADGADPFAFSWVGAA